MAHTSPGSDARASHGSHQKKSAFSTAFVVVAVIIASLVGFVAGTRGTELLSFVGSNIGIEVRTDELDLSPLQETYRKLQARFDGKLDDAKLVEYANKGMVEATGDEYTQYFTAKEAEDLRNDLSGNIGGGIGAEIGKRNGKTTIIRPLDNSPAAKAELQAGDVVIEVNDELVTGATVDEVVQKIRGEVGTTVKITVDRNGEPNQFSVTREEIIAPDVESEVAADNIGVIKVSRFDRETGANVRKAAEEFQKRDVKGIVLDLRGNGGGYLEAGIEVASVWLDDQVVVSERKGNKVIDERKSGSSPVLGNMPTTVLINAGSASASEIVAGALHDHGKATLVGEKSFGKGSVQELFDMSNGASLKVTIAKWYTPKGKNISESGIAPDTKVEMTADDINANRDPQLDTAVKQLQ